MGEEWFKPPRFIRSNLSRSTMLMAWMHIRIRGIVMHG